MTETPSPNAKPKAYTYLAVTVILLFTLSFTWSIDTTIAYIIGGAALYTSFLTVYHWPRKSNPEDRWRYQQDERSEEKQTYSTTPTPSSPPPKPASKSKPIKNIPKADFKTLFEKFTKEKKVKTLFESKTTSQKISKSGCGLFVGGFIFLFIVLAIIFSDDPDDREDMSFENQFSQAENYYNTGDYVQAIIHYKYALIENPKSTDASLGLGNAFAGLNNADSAFYYYRHTLTIDPNYDMARYNIGWLHYKNKNYEEAAYELKQLIDRNSSYLDAFQLLGDVYYDQQKYDDAFIYYERAYTSGQRNFWLCYVSGYLYQTKGNNQMAIDRYKEALTYDSSELDIYKRLGDLVPGEEGARYRARGEDKQW